MQASGEVIAHSAQASAAIVCTGPVPPQAEWSVAIASPAWRIHASRSSPGTAGSKIRRWSSVLPGTSGRTSMCRSAEQPMGRSRQSMSPIDAAMRATPSTSPVRILR